MERKHTRVGIKLHLFVFFLLELSQARYAPVICSTVLSVWFEKVQEEVTVRAASLHPASQSGDRSARGLWQNATLRCSHIWLSKHRDIVSLSPPIVTSCH